MADITKTLGLTKPLKSERYNVDVFNSNADIVDKLYANTIEELKQKTNYKLGDVVEVLGFHAKGDGSHHKRIAKSEDDGSGELGQNGIWWCIVHSGEVNVSWFGAKGDGVTDDAGAIQRAFNTNKAIFDKKEYRVASKLFITNSIEIQGSSSVLKFDNLNELFLIDITNVSGVHIANLNIESKTNFSSIGYNKSLYLSGCSNIKIDNVNITGGTQAMDFRTCNSISVTNCKTNNNNGTGLHFKECNDVYIFNCESANNGYDLNGVQTYDSARGILFWMSTNCRIVKCKTYGNSEYGLRLFSEPTDTKINKNIIIDDCDIYDNGGTRNSINFYMYNEYSDKPNHKDVTIKNSRIYRTKNFTAPTSNTNVSLQGENIIFDNNYVYVFDKASPITTSIYIKNLKISNINILENHNQFVSLGSGYQEGVSIDNCFCKCLKVLPGVGSELVTIKNSKFECYDNTSTLNAIDTVCKDLEVLNTTFDGFNRVFNIGGTLTKLKFINVVTRNTRELSIRVYAELSRENVICVGNNIDAESNLTILKTLNTSQGNLRFKRGAIPVSGLGVTPYKVGDICESTNANQFGWIYDGANWKVIPVSSTVLSLDTPYYTYKMQQEGVYQDYVAYRDELHEYENSQTTDETMLLPVLHEPEIPESVKQFAEKYKLI